MTTASDILKAHGIRARKSRGQNFLIDENIARKQVEYADLKSGETVLEIGPGLGILTELLVETGAGVIAVEKDRKLCDYLRERFGDLPGDRFKLIQGDALKADLGSFDKVVSNLPYNISSPITFSLLKRDFKLAILMYQREFGERMCAKAGDKAYSRLSVSVYYRAECELLRKVPSSAFHPRPKVDSVLMKLVPREPTFKVEDEALFLKTVEVLFSHRRKSIGKSLVLGHEKLGLDKAEMKELAESLEWRKERVERLAPEEIGNISDAIFGRKIYLDKIL